MKFFFTKRFYRVLGGLIVLFTLGYYWPLVYLLAKICFGVFFVITGLEAVLLFLSKGKVTGERKCSDRFSNGDENEVTVHLINNYGFTCYLQVMDEWPVILQKRDFQVDMTLPASGSKLLSYTVRPVVRGVYSFGYISILVTSSIGLIWRRFEAGAPKEVKVYPSFVRIHQYELMAISQNLTMQGQKQIRRVGNSKEFDTIRDYVAGDDPRNINWKATARRGHLMTNHYIDERAQNVYCILDKSRAMKMPFEGMTLLDYAVNASLVVSDVSLKRGDRAGLITFEDKISTVVPATLKNTQIYQVMEALYHQETSFKEADFSAVFNFANKNIHQRSLLLLFTNFESVHSLHRQMSYLKLLNRKHLVLLVYFRNTEVDTLMKQKAGSMREIYNQAIAHQMLEEKLLVRDQLTQSGILSLYTTPQNLNVDVINKYIEVKAKRML